MSKKIYFCFNIFVGLLLFLLVSSCDQIKTSIKDTFKSQEDVDAVEETSTDQEESVETPQEEPPVIEEITDEITYAFEDSSYYEKAQRDLLLLPKLKDKEILCYSSIHFYDDGRINLELQDPDSDTYLDAYSYEKGVWKDPQPLQSRSAKQLAKETFPLAKIRFSTVVDLCRQINQKIEQTPGAEEITHIYITYSSYSKKITWRGSISGDRDSYSIWADADGSNLRFDRN